MSCSPSTARNPGSPRVPSLTRETAARLGLRGWPRVAEEAIVIRDALLARDYGGRLHICHASTEGTVELLRWAKEHDIPLSAEVTPHHLVLTDEKLETYDGNFRVNPPLRGRGHPGTASGIDRRHPRLCRHRPRPARL